MDLKQDLFRVEREGADAATDEVLLGTIRGLNYSPSIVEGARFRPEGEPPPMAGEPPEAIRKAIDQARTESRKYVLAHLMGDG